MPILLQINVDSALYSCGKICEDIAMVAHSHGWDTYVAFGREHKAGINKEIKVGRMFNVYEHFAEQRLFDNEGLASRFPTKKLIKKIEEIKPDIIQLHIIHDHWINYRILFEYLSSVNTPVIWTLHDCWPFTGGCFYYDLENCDKWKSKCEDCPQKRSLIIKQTIRQYKTKKEAFGSKRNLTLVPVSDWLAMAARNSFLKNNRILTIHNGINLSLFKPLSRTHRKKDIVEIIGVAALWDKRKGLNDFLKLRAILPNRYHITLVGLNKEQINNLPEGISGIRRTHDIQELVQLYSNADLFVNPTYSDNFPTTNLEALACGTPVITYNTGGSPEAICNDMFQINASKTTFFETGAVVPQGSVEELLFSIETMMSINEKEREVQRRACRNRAEQLFDKNNVFKQYLSLYEELLINND